MPIVSKLQPKGSEDIYDIVDRVSDYSAFEVMPNAEAIAKGSIDTVTGLSYNNEVPACTVHKVRILSDIRVFDEANNRYNDVIIDWGDGTVEAIRDGVYAYDDSPGGYLATHDYAEALARLGVSSSTFIVRIYGKDYCTFRHNEVKTNNLISRIFDVDLPIASHITNLASTAIGAKRLLKVQIPFATKYISTASNIASVFEECINLKSVKGFAKSVIRDNCTTTSLFRLAKSLEETDFVFPRNSDSLHTTFYHTYRLKTNIEDHFPVGGFSSSHITLSGTFTSSAVKGTVPAELLWKSGKTWTITTASNEKAFSNAPNVRAQVPTSWGGTNEELERQLKFDNMVAAGLIDPDYYTAFEVMPNKVAITAGTSDEVTGLTYSNDIPACTEHKFTLRSAQLPNECDVIIDWGDGTVEAIRDGAYVSNTAGKAYELAHDYASKMTEDVQRFVVKIYGKDYYTFRHNSYKDNNLISRIFDAELPLASHVGSLASTVSYARRVLKVHFPHSTSPYSNIWNWTSTFQRCENMLSLTGFEDIKIREDAHIYSIVQECWSLNNTDFVIPAGCKEIVNVFNSCKALNCDINDLIPENGFTSNVIKISNAFRASAVTGTIPAEKFWNNKSIEWVFVGNTNGPFLNCTEEMRSQAPVSWGGTNEDLERQLKFDKMVSEGLVDPNDYTAFEVHPTSTDIAAGTVDDVTGFTYTYEVPAQMTAKFQVRTTASIEDMDVIVDWGDGSKQILKDGEYEEVSASGYTYTMSHTYTTPGRYIVKVFGKQYFALSSGSFTDNSLVSRCLDSDLPIASHLTNLSSLCTNSKRLLKVDVPFSKIMFRIINTASMFARCYNLVQATGFGGYASPAMFSCSWMFHECWSMRECDFILPAYFTDSWGIKGVFKDCWSLAVDINTLLPAQGFNVKNPQKTQIFMNTPVTGTVPADILFNDLDLNWVGEADAFYGCSDEIRAQVPVSWGGTLPDTEIKKSYDVLIQELEARIAELESKVS